MTTNHKTISRGLARATHFSNKLRAANGVIAENRLTLPLLAGSSPFVVSVSGQIGGHMGGDI